MAEIPVEPRVCFGEDHGYCCPDDYVPQPDGTAVHRDDPPAYTPAEVARLMEAAYEYGREPGVQAGREAAAADIEAAKPLGAGTWAQAMESAARVARGDNQEETRRE